MTATQIANTLFENNHRLFMASSPPIIYEFPDKYFTHLKNMIKNNLIEKQKEYIEAIEIHTAIYFTYDESIKLAKEVLTELEKINIEYQCPNIYFK